MLACAIGRAARATVRRFRAPPALRAVAVRPGIRRLGTQPAAAVDPADRADSAKAEARDPSSPQISASSVLKTVHEYRTKYPNCVLLVRVGDFYELYYEQADDYGGDLLGLQVVDKKFRGGTVRFTGFPARSLLRYVELLVARHGLSVALCEQFQQDNLLRTFTRKVTRVITPGTLIDDECLADTRVHNFILCMFRQGQDSQTRAYHEQLERWQREKERMEAEHRTQVDRAEAEARRRWMEANNARPPRRKRGRPPKNESLANIIEFDPTTVQRPPPPAIPPMPTPPAETSRGNMAEDTGATEDTELFLAWLDLATGDFMTCVSSPSALSSDVARIRPREILVDQGDTHVHSLLSGIYPRVHSSLSGHSQQQPSVTKVAGDLFERRRDEPQNPAASHGDGDTPSRTEAPSMNPNAYWQMSAPSHGMVASPELLLEASELSRGEQAACCGLLNYILDTQLGLLPPLQPPRRYEVEGHMRMSAATIQAFELLRPLSGDQRHRQGAADSPGLTLIGEIDHTRTSAGGRLLARRLTAPSTSVDIIEQRLDLVEFFTGASRVRDLILDRLGSVGDVERAVNKLSLNCGGPHDLLEIARTLNEVSKIKRALQAHLCSAAAPEPEDPLDDGPRRRTTVTVESHRRGPTVREIIQRKEQALQGLSGLVRNIASKIRTDANRDLRAFGFLRPNCSDKITQLHAQLADKEAERRSMQHGWQTAYQCPSLRLDTIPALGHFIEVTKRDSEKLLGSEFRMIQSLKSKVRFENPRWTYLLSEIEMLRGRIQTEEMRVFEELRDSVLAASTAIRTNSRVLADVDVAISMAQLATTRQYTRPQLVSDSDDPHSIANGRHPVVESQLLEASRQYVGNDCTFEPEKSRVLLLTGPNMGGKSTYLRQVALTSVLAQIGSFVPAERARLHIVDAIYSRIGAHDNLALNQSTFMVEMSETADILRHATPRSLVILDEIGRGTATADGIAIAYATLRYLHDHTKCKALFATHYHELVPFVRRELSALAPLHTAIFEDGAGGFAFLHKVRPGVCTQSHALYVAQIAGIPKPVLAIAKEFAARRLGSE
ncbi:MutS protein 1 [Coemansia sp. RSA 552]|nr:MutS protein 1 [Coemansia sp. RSA 552]